PCSSTRAQARRASRNSPVPATMITSPTSTVMTAASGPSCTSIPTALSTVMTPMKTPTAPSHIRPELDPALTVVGAMVLISVLLLVQLLPAHTSPVRRSALVPRLLDGRFAQLHVTGRDLLALPGVQLELLDTSRRGEVGGGGLEVRERGLGGHDGHREDRGLLGDLRI